MNRPPLPPPPHTGGCLCGAVRYSYDARPLALNACHCIDCQKLSGATNLLIVFADRSAFRHLSGEVRSYRKRADSGREADYFSCATCNVRAWHVPLSAPQYVLIAAGTLDDPSWVVPTTHIWVSRALPTAAIPEGVCALPLGPADRAELIAEFQRVYPED
jgi:hypothetical protein